MTHAVKLELLGRYTSSVIDTYLTLFPLLYFPQLVDPPEGFTFGTIKDTSTEDFFRKSSSARLRKIYENMKDHNVETFSDGMKKVRSGWVLLSYTEHLATLVRLM